MATKKKMLQAAAGNAGGASLDITDVFSTYLYEGNGSTQTITNGIDLDGEGGLVWIKNRSDTSNHYLWDTVSDNVLFSNLTNAGYSTNPSYTALSNGFSILSTGFGTSSNFNSTDYASWTFRKAPKFFDVVTYTGDGNTSQTISHNLGSTPGHMAVKPFSRTGNWRNYHRTIGATGCLFFNLTNATSTTINQWNNTEPTDSSFTVGINSNLSGETYVAYLFAHNDGDGEFGPDGNADVIKCGSYTGNGSTDGPEIDLGFEPQWLMYKNTDGTDNWEIVDTMRGMPADGNTMRILKANSSAAESSDNAVGPNATGFKVTNPGGSNNDNGSTYIYIAIRRGPLAAPESGTEVFDVQTKTISRSFVTTNFVTDFYMQKRPSDTDNWYSIDRMTGGAYYLSPNTTATQVSITDSYYQSDLGYNNGYENNLFAGGGSTSCFWSWKRAPNFFDVVAYTGNGVNDRQINHNLAAAPEMMWMKKRFESGGSGSSTSWRVFLGPISSEGAVKVATLNSDGIAFDDTTGNYSSLFYNKLPTENVFTIGNSSQINRDTYSYIAYLFASLPGISKVGSYTGTGATLNIDCGFTSGARFVLIKKTTGSSDMNWWVFDTARGLVSGDDARLFLNTTDAEYAADYVDPYSGGFAVSSFLSENGLTYIFYAIA
jgi:hypothetical protein